MTHQLRTTAHFPAPTGRRAVATGGATPLCTSRNPWKTCVRWTCPGETEEIPLSTSVTPATVTTRLIRMAHTLLRYVGVKKPGMASSSCLSTTTHKSPQAQSGILRRPANAIVSHTEKADCGARTRRGIARVVALIFSIGLATACPMASAQTQYTITDLGTLGGTTSQALSISASGEVVGWSHLNNGVMRAFVYSNGTMRDLGTLPDLYHPASAAQSINAAGQIVGWSNTYVNEQVLLMNGSYAAFFGSGAVQNIHPIGIMFDYSSSAMGINDAGQVAGIIGDGRVYISDANGGGVRIINDALLAFNDSWTPGRVINSSGQVIFHRMVAGYPHAFRWTNGTEVDLGNLAGDTRPTAINDAGQVVGFSGSAAFLYTNGIMQNIGGFGGYSVATGINNTGQIVGLSNQVPFVYDNNSLRRLDLLIGQDSNSWTALFPTAINDAGQIVGYGTNSAGQQHAILLTPCWPTVESSPSSTSTCPFGTAAFSVTAAGTGPFTYQWQWQPAGDGTPWCASWCRPRPGASSR